MLKVPVTCLYDAIFSLPFELWFLMYWKVSWSISYNFKPLFDLWLKLSILATQTFACFLSALTNTHVSVQLTNMNWLTWNLLFNFLNINKVQWWYPPNVSPVKTNFHPRNSMDWRIHGAHTCMYTLTNEAVFFKILFTN